MTYTDKKPTEPGWYWYCGRGWNHTPLIVYWNPERKIRVMDCLYRPEAMDGQFAGPIPEPEKFAELEAEAAKDESTGCMMGGEGWPAGIRYALKRLGLENKQ